MTLVRWTVALKVITTPNISSDSMNYLDLIESHHFYAFYSRIVAVEQMSVYFLCSTWKFNVKIIFISRLLAARNIQRPQVCFKTPVDNSNKTPFEPRIKYKPNSIKPLAVLPEYDPDGNIEGYLHPYETELNKFEAPSSLLKQKDPLKPKRLEETPLMYVDTVKQLKQLMETELVGVSELAVDLEHHSYRTFQVRHRPGILDI